MCMGGREGRREVVGEARKRGGSGGGGRLEGKGKGE